MKGLVELETERLLLRVPVVEDAERICRFVARNREHLAPFEPRHGEGYYTAAYWRRALRSFVRSFPEGRLMHWILLRREDPAGPVVGRSTFSEIVRGPFQAAYLAYALDREAVGEGLMTEALRALITYAFEELGLHRIMANYVPTNRRSAALLERLGFVEEGYARDYLRLDGRWQDHVLTALINDAWRES